MLISFDPAKRELTLEERGLDFEDARIVFRGPVLTQTDDRFVYGEVRYQTYGLLTTGWSWWCGQRPLAGGGSSR